VLYILIAPDITNFELSKINHFRPASELAKDATADTFLSTQEVVEALDRYCGGSLSIVGQENDHPGVVALKLPLGDDTTPMVA